MTEQLPNESEQPAETPVDLAQLAGVLAAMQAQLAAISARVEALPTTQDLAEVSQQLVSLQEQGEHVARQAESAGRSEQVDEARKLSKSAVTLLLAIAAATAEALWQAFVQEEIYKPLAVKVGALLEQAGELTIGPAPVAPTIPSQPVPTPPHATPAPAQAKAAAIKRPPIEFDWVTVPAGAFLMGSDPRIDKDALKNEQPQHRIYPAAFQIARVPVTNQQFAQFVEATRYQTEAEDEGWDYCWYQPDGPGSALTGAKADHPVVCVSWHDAMAFCRWALVRLPNEVEWEKAARGPDGRLYPWGNHRPTGQLCNFGDMIGDTSSVGQYSRGRSPYGALDMAGNVWEWCSNMLLDSIARRDYRYPYNGRDGREDAKRKGQHALRGGSWRDDAASVRCASCRIHDRLYADDPGPLPLFGPAGFRVARSLA